MQHQRQNFDFYGSYESSDSLLGSIKKPGVAVAWCLTRVVCGEIGNWQWLMIVAAAEKVESSRNVQQSFRKTTLLSYVVLCCLGYSGSARKKKRRLQSRAMQQCGSTRATTCNLKQTRKGGRVSEMELPFAFVVSRRGGNLQFTVYNYTRRVPS